MENLSTIKVTIFGVLSAIGSGIAYICGGWDTAMQTLVVFMAIDYALGITLALTKRSGKTTHGTLDSRIGFVGLMKKVAILLAVITGSALDAILGDAAFARTAIIIFFIANEGLSIIENLALMGVPFPDKVTKVLEQLKTKSNKEEKTE